MSDHGLLVFGDDWGAHPSTTQHLVRHLPAADRVVWVDSIGMRSPRPTPRDLRRILGRLRPSRRAGEGAPGAGRRTGMQVVRPRILPWHRTWQRLNRALLARPIRRAMKTLGLTGADALLSNPVAVLYLDGLPVRRVTYLRLDDYAGLPGVDEALVAPLEARLLARADAVVATARRLLPDDRATYLPQGVDLAHFAAVPPSPPPVDGRRVLGFFGLLAGWIDVPLVASVAAARPDWTLELLGPRALDDEALAPLRAASNIVLRDPVPYADLPSAIGHWHAAWAPFAVDDTTRAVNPLKLREYLAAGLPTACTPLPEAEALAPHVAVPAGVDAVAEWLTEVAEADDEAARGARRAAVSSDGWAERAAILRAIAHGEAAP